MFKMLSTTLMFSLLTVGILIFRPHIVVCDMSDMILEYHHKYCKSALCFANSSSTTKSPIVTTAESFNFEEITTTQTVLGTPSFILELESVPDIVPLFDDLCGICTECSCDEDCIVYGTCCPDISIGHPQFPIDCVHMTIADEFGFFNSDSYYMVTNCTAENSNNSNGTCKQCLEGALGFSTNAEYLPVTVNISGRNIVFKNKFCALAHGFYNHMIWKMMVICHNKIDLKNLQNVKNVYSWVESLGCSFAYVPPNNDLKRCSLLLGVLSQCNSTGKWETYDKTIEDACYAYSNPTEELNNHIFVNMFCYLCNEVEDELTMSIPCVEKTFSNGDFFDTVPFSAILNFQDDVEPTVGLHNNVNECANDELFDTFTDQCRTLVCLELRHYKEDKCKWIVDSLRGVEFQMNIHSFPNASINTNGNLSYVMVTVLQNFIKQYFNDSVKLSSISMSIIVDQQSQLLKHILLILKFYVEDSFKPQDVIDKILSFQIINFVTNVDGTPVLFTMVVVYPESMIINLNTTTSTSILSTNTFILHFTEIVSIVIPVFLDNECSMFEYSMSELVITDELVFFTSTNRSINITNARLTASGNISVCVHWMMSYAELSNSGGNLKQYKSSTALTITYVVCLIASLVCYFLTFLVYSLVAELQTIHGINLIFLCVSLFFANGFFLVGAGATSNHLLCQTFGILIHYFWLVSFCWMNISSLYTFRVFNSVMPSNMKQNKRPIVIKFLAFSNALPLLLIIFVIIISSTSKSGSIGYGDGKRVCFISSFLPFVLTFLVPVGLTVILTTIVLVMIGVSLKKMSFRRKALGQKEMNTILQCFKLSSLTGISWIFGSLGTYLQVEVLNYIFVILCGGQGVFVLLAFVLNKRVLGACREAVRRKFRRNSNLSTSGDMKKATQRINLSTVNSLSLSPTTNRRLNYCDL